MKAYLVRGKGSGVHYDKVYLRPPTNEELRAEMDNELAKHGLKPGTFEPVSVWVRVQEVEVVGVPSDLTVDATTELACLEDILTAGDVEEMQRVLAQEATSGVVANADIIMFAGVGTVTNPTE